MTIELLLWIPALLLILAVAILTDVQNALGLIHNELA